MKEYALENHDVTTFQVSQVRFHWRISKVKGGFGRSEIHGHVEECCNRYEGEDACPGFPNEPTAKKEGYTRARELEAAGSATQN